MTEFILCRGTESGKTCERRDNCARYTTHRVEGDKLINHMCGVRHNEYADYYLADLQAAHHEA